MNWSGWSLDRLLILFVALAFVMIAVQVTMSHYKQNFHHKAMYVPVVETPLFALTAFALSFYRPDWLVFVFAGLMWIGVFSGMAGFYYHVHGVGVRVGGFEVRNFLMGPPVILPLMISAIAALGLFALYWR